jgi:hypothetical protein
MVLVPGDFHAYYHNTLRLYWASVVSLFLPARRDAGSNDPIRGGGRPAEHIEMSWEEMPGMRDCVSNGGTTVENIVGENNGFQLHLLPEML